jgi:hypothetical protein
MTMSMDDTLTAIGRQLSITYLPTVRTDSVYSLGGSLAMQGPARTVKTTAGAVETGASSHTKSASEHEKAAQAPVPSMMLVGEQPVRPRPRGASQ